MPKRHPWWWVILSTALITFPQWASGTWALFSTEPLFVVLARHSLSVSSFLRWMPVVIGIAGFVIVCTVEIRSKWGVGKPSDSTALTGISQNPKLFTIEIQEISKGCAFESKSWFLFLMVRLVPERNLGIKSITGAVETSQGKQECEFIADLKEWWVREETKVDWYPNVTHTDVPAKGSLWSQVEVASLSRGIPVKGWVLLHVLEAEPSRDDVHTLKAVTLNIEDGEGNVQSETLHGPWMESSSKFIHDFFKQHR